MTSRKTGPLRKTDSTTPLTSPNDVTSENWILPPGSAFFLYFNVFNQDRRFNKEEHGWSCHRPVVPSRIVEEILELKNRQN